MLHFFCVFAFAELYPIRRLTVDDGLPQNTINAITEDDKGFFWIATSGGLARFDGYEFVNFTMDQGLPSDGINDILISDSNIIWLGTNLGLVKFDLNGKLGKDSSAPRAFTVYQPVKGQEISVKCVMKDLTGRLWFGTEKGLFYVDESNGKLTIHKFELPLPANAKPRVYSLKSEPKGGIIVGLERFLVRIDSNSATHLYESPSGSTFLSTHANEDGELYVGTSRDGLVQFSIDKKGNFVLKKNVASETSLKLEWVDSIAETDDKKFVLGGVNGLFEFDTKTNRVFHYTRSSGLAYNRFQRIFKDRKGNLWIGTKANGIFVISRERLFAFGLEDGISFVRSVKLDNAGNLMMTAFITSVKQDISGSKVEWKPNAELEVPFSWRLGILKESNFTWIMPNFKQTVAYYGWGDNHLSMQAKNGEWWVVTGEGLFRFPNVEFSALASVEPIAVYNKSNGLKSDEIYRIFEDSNENIWISSQNDHARQLYRINHRDSSIEEISSLKGYEQFNNPLVNALVQAADGTLFLGSQNGGLCIIKDREFQFIERINGIKLTGISDLLLDKAGRLWVATQSFGVFRVDNPTDKSATFYHYNTKNGLSSMRTFSLSEDGEGIIYVGTDRDINQIDSAKNRIKSFSLAKDLPQREFRSAVTDKNGVLWFGTTEGLVKFDPQSILELAPPNLLFTSVSVNNTQLEVPLNGVEKIELPALESDANQIRFEFVSLGNFEDRNIKYQYKFEDQETWSPLSEDRFINFANLSPREYRLQIRAINSNNAVSAHPATANFTVMPPFYLRWWFLALCVLVVASIIYLFYRVRVQRLLEIERTRTLIATDLHDDIGSNLSKIAVLSEVVRLKLNKDGKDENALLNSIAEISRDSVTSMSDIVWAINPQRDSVVDLIRKMRQHAEETFVSTETAVSFIAPRDGSKIKIPMALRRDIYLTFKEALNNVVKHANCSEVKIKIAINSKEFEMVIDDNGNGFDMSLVTQGNGLINMRKRVARLNGSFEIESNPMQGTKIQIRIPQI
ncbi:MAG: two-component regulator propeller domain-containing protein [Pyrinomonadaceae bacterium]